MASNRRKMSFDPSAYIEYVSLNEKNLGLESKMDSALGFHRHYLDLRDLVKSYP